MYQSSLENQVVLRAVRVGLLAGMLMLSFAKTSFAQSPWQADAPLPLRGIGISLAGPEFGVSSPQFSNASPGRLGSDYHYNSPQACERIAEREFRFVRLPFRWERLQPELGGPLKKWELLQLKKQVATAERCGLRVILDLHNYGRYQMATGDQVTALVIDNRTAGEHQVTRHHLADLWKRLASEFHDSPAVVAYGVMNEPHGLGRGRWRRASQIAVEAIRSVDNETWILVGGDEWSSAPKFSQTNGPRAWIKDPVGRTAYEAHCYFDFDHTGKYRLTYEQELQIDPQLATRGAERLQDFIAWCEKNQVRGVIGEFGAPNNDPRWQKVVVEFLQAATDANMPTCAWAAGEWWGNYPLSLHPSQKVQDDLPLLQTLTRLNRQLSQATAVAQQ